MRKRKIVRIAFLQDYTGFPKHLLNELEELPKKGYAAVALTARNEDMEAFRSLCSRASALGLAVSAFTGYMKYQHRYLAEHPEQRMVKADERQDEDGFDRNSWGCPFNKEFKARYFRLLREIASCPGVFRILVNDEAYLGSGCYCQQCMDAYEAQAGGEMPRKAVPTQKDWLDGRWRRYLKWKIDRWNDVHGEMAKVVHEINPRIEVAFQASPASDLWENPWHSCVDLHGMVRQLDGLCTDPYYTFHKRLFDPAEVYLSEWSRFLSGITPPGKRAEIIPQGFSHPTFTRPLGEQDGYWSALVPPACGIDLISPYSYTLQRCSPVQKTYESCFALDPYFERAAPLKYAVVVHGVQSEIYRHPLPVDTPWSYDGTRLLPVTESLRHRGVPYGYYPDARLNEHAAASEYKVVVLPQIDCVSEDQARGLRRFIEEGGNAVILGQLGAADEVGDPRKRPLLEELTRIRVADEHGREEAFQFCRRLDVAESIQTVDQAIAERYLEGTMAPQCKLRYCVDAELPPRAEVLAEFTDEDGNPTGKPAIVALKTAGTILWFAGFPSRMTRNNKYGTTVRNMAHQWFAALTEWAAGEKPRLRVEGWPPDVPMKRLRPLDQRYMNTFEFFPLAGDDLFLGVVTSYFREPTSFAMVLDAPASREVVRVVELISGETQSVFRQGQSVRVQVVMEFDTPARVFLFELR